MENFKKNSVLLHQENGGVIDLFDMECIDKLCTKARYILLEYLLTDISLENSHKNIFISDFKLDKIINLTPTEQVFYVTYILFLYSCKFDEKFNIDGVIPLNFVLIEEIDFQKIYFMETKNT